MEFEIGKEYLYTGQKAKLVFIDEETEGTKFLVVHEVETIGYIASWAGEGDLGELSPYHDFKRGEPVMAISCSDRLYRRHFSHVDDKGRPHCFERGLSAWSSEGMTSAWESVRKLTPEEREECNKCL